VVTDFPSPAQHQPQQYVDPHSLITTGLEFPGWAVGRILGPVFGISVRSMGIGKSFTAGFRALAQGEMPEFEELLTTSRQHAMDRMIEHARQLGANAVIGFRFDASDFAGQFTEIVAYGTAVVVTAAAPSTH
jgi:uncharacterized protein YbjQ (UPF0145 family)